LRTKKTYTLIVSFILVLSVIVAAGCSEGDDESPARVRDLHFFDQADALVFTNRVSQGSTAGESNTRILAWTAPGDDDYDGTASIYDMRYITSTDLDRLGYTDGAALLRSRWDLAREFSNEEFPQKGGRLEQKLMPRFAAGDTVWFALRTYDEVGLDSGISNVAGPVNIQRLNLPLREASGDTVLGLGTRVAALADFDGDRVTDFLLSNPDQARAVIIKGGGSSVIMPAQTNAQGINVRTAAPELVSAMVFSGDTTEDFGASVAALYLVNSDNLSDIGVGAPLFDDGSTLDAGAVYIKYGQASPPAVLGSDSADIIITGEASGDLFGSALATAFDIDADGGNEVLVGAPGAFGTGAVYVFRGLGLTSGKAGQALAVITGEATGDGFGDVVAPLGDVNGDGVFDFAVGAPGKDDGSTLDAGAVYIFYGGASGVGNFSGIGAGGTVIDLSVEKADVTIRGTASARRFGKKIASGGDLLGDGDRAVDFAVSGGNTVFFFYGGLSGTVPFPESGDSLEALDVNATQRLEGTGGEDFGAAISSAGDLDRDGVMDFVIGAPGSDRCYLFDGPIVSGELPVEIIQSVSSGTRFCEDVSSAGDLFFDGFPDLVISAPQAGEAYFSY